MTATRFIEVKLSTLVLHPDLQPRLKTDPRTVERYRVAMAAGAVFPPIKVAHLNGALVLVDGFHRVAAMKAVLRHDCLAEDLGGATWEEAGWLACQANLAHGVPLKKGEFRKAFRAYVRAGKHRAGKARRARPRSYREMAQDLGGVIAHTTVRKWMADDFPSVFRSLSVESDHGGRGGLRNRNASSVMAAEVRIALDHAMAAVPGVLDPEARFRLLQKARDLVSTLEEGPLSEPDF